MWTICFSNVRLQNLSGQICSFFKLRIFGWKAFKNLFTFAKIMMKRQVTWFLTHGLLHLWMVETDDPVIFSNLTRNYVNFIQKDRWQRGLSYALVAHNSRKTFVKWIRRGMLLYNWCDETKNEAICYVQEALTCGVFCGPQFIAWLKRSCQQLYTTLLVSHVWLAGQAGHVVVGQLVGTSRVWYGSGPDFWPCSRLWWATFAG